MTNAPAIQLISQPLLDDLLHRAADSPRRRINYNFHATAEENPNRFLNVMLRGSYFTPHRHRQPPKAESFLLLEGRLAFFQFDDAGEITACHILDAVGPLRGIDVAPGVWHTLAVLSDHCICFEVKPGPYEAATDKEFAPWAPHEGQPGCADYLDSLLDYAKRIDTV